MKPNRLFTILVVASTLSLSTTVFAQPGMGRQNRGMQNQDGIMCPAVNNERIHDRMDFEQLKLTDEQKAKIKDVKLAHQKEVMKHKNKMAELRAHLQTLSTADVVDMKAINATIDEITQSQNQLMKSREGFKQQVRALLTDEQRIQFDLHQGMLHRPGGKRMHQRQVEKDE